MSLKPLTTAAAHQIAEQLKAWLLERAGKGDVYRVLSLDNGFAITVGPEPKRKPGL